jgi:hypothetical protein
MYPFVSWSDDELQRRFAAMQAAELHPEPLVVAHRVIEQLLNAEHGVVATGLRDPRMRCVRFGSLR